MNDINIINLFLNVSFVVKFIILIIIGFSIISWTIIIQQIQLLRLSTREAKFFKNYFWSNINLMHLFKKYQSRDDKLTGAEQIFYSGFKEFLHLRQVQFKKPEVLINEVSRVMQMSINNELENLETKIYLLGTIGSISPYVGLLGTILGIIHTFMSLGTTKQITLQIIAPGIAESLMVTAISLFSAIPAVIAYNAFTQYITKIELYYNYFMAVLLSILHRRIYHEDKL